tara:strand:- start:21 stop:905 length:885 start_codon:yes stop_codon:yes gene_type:complete
MSFASLKRNRDNNMSKLTQALQDTQTETKSFGDDRIWKPERDKSGNGFAIIRFLPQPEGEDLPWARVWNHGFQGPGGWYIENSLTTIGQKDPVSEYNTTLWNNGTDAGKDQARKQKRRLNYYSNIYVIKDGSNPQNEGKVFLYRYGKKIFDKLNECMNPEFEDETPINPFDFWEGADFKLKVRTLDGFVNYDKSEFDSPSALFDGDEGALEKVYNQQHSLSELISPDNFKTYSELKQQLDRALGVKEVQEVLEETPWQETKVEEPQIQNSTEVSNGGDTSEELSYFKKLAAESL